MRPPTRLCTTGASMSMNSPGNTPAMEQRANCRDHKTQAPLRQTGPDEDGLEGQPFRHEAVQRRQRRNRRAADEECYSGPRHAMDEAAEALHVAFAGRREHSTSAEEQKALENRMIEHMKQGSSHSECRRQLHVIATERQRQP